MTLRVKELLPVGTCTSVLVYGRGKYGRWVGDIVLTEEQTLGSWLVENELAEWADY